MLFFLGGVLFLASTSHHHARTAVKSGVKHNASLCYPALRLSKHGLMVVRRQTKVVLLCRRGHSCVCQRQRIDALPTSLQSGAPPQATPCRPGPSSLQVLRAQYELCVQYVNALSAHSTLRRVAAKCSRCGGCSIDTAQAINTSHGTVPWHSPSMSDLYISARITHYSPVRLTAASPDLLRFSSVCSPVASCTLLSEASSALYAAAAKSVLRSARGSCASDASL